MRETYARVKSHAATPCGRAGVEDTLNVCDYLILAAIAEGRRRSGCRRAVSLFRISLCWAVDCEQIQQFCHLARLSTSILCAQG